MKILIQSAILLLFVSSANAQIRTDFDRSMNKPAEPFKIIGNIYYVGASDIASYLITTTKGHILIDSGFEETVPMIENNVKKLGFDLRDVKILLNNHAHSDHAGGLKLLKEKTGAKLYSVKEQAASLKVGDKNNFAFGEKLSFKPVNVDKIIKDRQKIKLGKTTLKTHLTPGHTKGCTTWTTRIKENGRKYRVIFQCSISALRYNLIDNPLYPNHAEDFQKTFAKLKKMKVDVFLGSHAQFFKMDAKLKRWKKDRTQNPFIDSKGYKDFVARMEKSFLRKLAAQQKEKAKPD